MKKVLLTIALAAFAFAANAQFVVGGQINFSNHSGNSASQTVAGTTTTTWNLPDDIYTSLTLKPRIGYNLSDNMQVGVSLGVNWYSNKFFNSVYGGAYGPTTQDLEDWRVNSGMSFTIAPYFRYNLFEVADNLNLFCEAQFDFTYTGKPSITEHASAFAGLPAIDTTYTGNTTDTRIGLIVTPGLNYKFSDNFSADLYIDLLGIGYTYTNRHTFNDMSVGGVTNTYENTITTSDFFLTANTDAQSLVNHLNLFRLGFNYHF